MLTTAEDVGKVLQLQNILRFKNGKRCTFQIMVTTSNDSKVVTPLNNARGVGSKPPHPV
jgi:hypothetical protein